MKLLGYLIISCGLLAEYTKDTSAEKKEHDKKINRTDEDQTSIKTETTDGTESVKEEQSQSQDIEMADAAEADPVASAVVKNCDLQGAGNDGDINDTRKYISIRVVYKK